jgi:hypothetical protein
VSVSFGRCAGNVEKLAFGLIDVVEFDLVGRSLDGCLERQHFLVARHHDDGLELKPLRQVHGADGDAVAGSLDSL